MAAEMMQRVETLPVELYFQVPRNNFERTRCLNLLEAREYEVRAWLEKECPELAEVPLDWVFEVLSPREW